MKFDDVNKVRTYDLKELVKKRAHFVRYEDRKLWYAIFISSSIPEMPNVQDKVQYSITDMFEFPIPVDDADGGTFNDEEDALIFMRWIRKHLQFHEEMLLLKNKGTNCMGCQAGWPLTEYKNTHSVVGGYPHELVACTKDKH